MFHRTSPARANRCTIGHNVGFVVHPNGTKQLQCQRPLQAFGSFQVFGKIMGKWWENGDLMGFNEIS